MLREDPTHYLSAFREFLVNQQSQTNDPAIEKLIAEINRELLKRAERGPVC